MSRVVYGVARAPLPAIERAGVDGAPVEQVGYDDLVAIVSTAPDELLARRRDVTAHMDVLDEAMRHGPVLPFRFGAVADDDEAVAGMLRDRAQDLRAQLTDLTGSVQVTLRVTRDEDTAVRDAVAADPRLQRLVASSRSRRGSLAGQVQLGEQISAAVAARTDALRAAAIERLRPHVVALMPADDPAAVISLAMLVHQEKVTAVDAVVADLAQELGDGTDVDYAGPMPAYSFVG